ncbi:Coatomer subunit delta [Meloidogyne graminicola]|uniref:Coatomer subunit delta n=1 Tax=Meloidogyne graminicola TaxID=189291 RepID=A0A8S9ZSW4_9BILA|nr:Coatomer subunit delta [Meloidogyne graminicola]
MVLIAASVFTKSGKALVTRQYVSDMTRARLEGLLDAFPKLTSDKNQRQHTFVETDSVRYVYQPLDNIYMVLITTKASNILEDLETLRLFARLIPEYCRSNDEAEIANKAFDLIFAFDEVVVLGYRENVNLAQVRTFTDMDSHEERVFNQMQIAQQKAALSLMKEKEKEIKRQEKLKKHLKGGVIGASKGISSLQARAEITSAVKDSTTTETTGGNIFGSFKKSAPIAGGGKALKLGGKSAANEDVFLQQLCAEGEKLNVAKGQGTTSVVESTDKSSDTPVNFKCIEKLNVTYNRVGRILSAETQGSISLTISDPKFNNVVIKIANDVAKLPGYSAHTEGIEEDQDLKGVQIQIHPNLDKKQWQSSSILRLKSEQKPYPVGVDVSLLKWNLKMNDATIPLTLNCWPNEMPNGCMVSVEYTLERLDLELCNVQITIPLPPATAPLISECEGSYEYIKSKSQLVWTLTSIDKTNKNGTLEFSTPNGHTDHFFPVNIRFSSLDSCCKITVESVERADEQILFSNEQSLITEKYEIV